MTASSDDIRRELEKVRRLNETLKEEIRRLHRDRETSGEERRFRGSLVV